jgi:cysteinyl-tRNA synthetase
MSKSLGNLVLVRDLLRTYPGDAIRHYLVSHHYRSEVDFAEGDLARSADAVARLRGACLRAQELAPAAPPRSPHGDLPDVVRQHRERFLAAMDDDLDTPTALDELDELGALAHSGQVEVAAEAGWILRELGARILGLRLAVDPGKARAEAA